MTNKINHENSGPGFYETSKYRCLVDARKQSDMLYLLLCGVDPSRFYAIVNRALEQPDLNLAGDLLHVGLLAEFLSLAIQSNISSEQAPRREAEYSADMYVDYAVNYINANYATARINNVASYIGIHRSCLTGIFKKKWASRPRSI